jgi:sugar/nucleoside kinase (ribokinase family)
MGCSLAINDSIYEVGMTLAKTVKGSGGTVSLDPNLRSEILGIEQCRNILLPVVKMADIILPSGDEACLLTGDADADTACQRLIEMGVQVVVLKLGEHGCRVYSPEGVFDIPGFTVEAVDPTGAGDCFDAGFVSGYLEGMSLLEAARLATAMGALGASRKGPMEGTFRREEVEAFMSRATDNSSAN